MTDEGFVRRWSRRKSAARAPDREPEPAPDVPAAEPASAPGDAPVAEIDPATLPDIESLTYQSDYTAFLQKGVPLDLRHRALQRLWRSDPLLANLDGLVEYGEDYSKVGMVKEVVRTAYQVGRGMLDRIEAAAAAPPEPPAARAADEAAGGDAAAIDAGAEAVAGGADDDPLAPAPQPPPKRP
jgi:Protein of unknown function (DUF3306)